MVDTQAAEVGGDDADFWVNSNKHHCY